MEEHKLKDVKEIVSSYCMGIDKDDLYNTLSLERKVLNDLEFYRYQELVLNYYNVNNALQELSELATDTSKQYDDISDLKKRIKYCKNPLEKKNLERQLNATYKEQKMSRKLYNKRDKR